MIRAYNHQGIQARGGNLCGNDDFTIVACKTCGWQYLYEHEVERVFHDPQDLSKYFFPFEGMPQLPCVSCGTPDWDFEEIEFEERQKVESGPWAWVLDQKASA